MATNRARGFFMVICLLLCKDGWLRHPARQRSLCGDWTPYLDGKCVKILETTGSKNQAEAEVVCWSSYSTLISVKTSKEQQFLQPFLFDEHKLEASVWLGLTQHGHSREFKWNDGSTMLFNNLVQHNTTENHYRCVAMASGRGINEEGLWVKSDCEMNNAVVCERESRTMNASDSTFMKDAPAQVIVQNDLEEKILLKSEKECDEKFGLLKQASLQTRDFMKEAAEKITAAIEHVKMAPEKRTDRSPAQKSDVSHSLLDSACGDWTPYKNEKCIKLVVPAGLQSKEEGDVICKEFTKESYGDDNPKLVTIKTEEKQKFLEKLLFEDLGDLDNVWMGLELGMDDEFHWNDRTDLLFTNWNEQSGSDGERKCVQMESGEGISKKGKWVRVNCKKRNAVVCEKTQVWTLAAMQDIVLSLKQEVARIKEESEREIDSLKQNTVPVGFVYVQLPDQDSPTTLWPQTSWKNVGSKYAGLFFRVEGGEAAPFGELQGDNTRRLAQAVWHSDPLITADMEIPSDGSWSLFRNTVQAGGRNQYGLKFRLTTGEVRPKNKSVKIWQRIK